MIPSALSYLIRTPSYAELSLRTTSICLPSQGGTFARFRPCPRSFDLDHPGSEVFMDAGAAGAAQKPGHAKNHEAGKRNRRAQDDDLAVWSAEDFEGGICNHARTLGPSRPRTSRHRSGVCARRQSSHSGPAALSRNHGCSPPGGRALPHPLNGNLAGNTSSNFPHPSRVTCSKFLGSTLGDVRTCNASVLDSLCHPFVDISRRQLNLACRPTFQVERIKGTGDGTLPTTHALSIVHDGHVVWD